MKSKIKVLKRIIVGAALLFWLSYWISHAITFPTRLNDWSIKHFSTGNVWGTRFESEDGLRKLFLGVQKGTTQFNEDLTSQNTFLKKGENQFHYKIDIFKYDILLNILAYHKTAPREKWLPAQANEELKFLNYVVENDGRKKCNTDDIVLLGQGKTGNHATNSIEETPVHSIFAVLIQFAPK